MRLEDSLNQSISSHGALSFTEELVSSFPKMNLYLVGGAVRDTLLCRRIREFDFDFVVQGLDQASLEAWLSDRGELNLVGQHFGVYKFMPTGFSPKDIAFIDIQSDPNLPIENDLARRDFTINAMAFDVRTRTLIDPFNGRGDIQRKVIRAVGNPTERFIEDLSRMLRGIRFAAELTFTVEEETSAAIRALLQKINAQKEVDGKLEYVVSRETVGAELAKMLSRSPMRGLFELQTHGALSECFPEVQSKLDADPNYLTPLAQATPGELTLVLALLLRGLNRTEVRRTLSFTGLDTLERGSSWRTETNHIVSLIDLLQKNFDVIGIQTMRASEFERCFFHKRGLLLLRCLELLGQKELMQAILTRRKQMEDRWLVDQDEAIAPILSGQDILAKGVPAGPHVRLLLDQVRDRQLDGELMRREDALTWLRYQLKQKSSI